MSGTSSWKLGPARWPSRSRDRDQLLLSEIALVQRMRDGQSNAEIARALGVSVETVKSTKRKLRAHFGRSDVFNHPGVIGQIS